jgi:L-ascorbate metabolism protein UlaG (beta-lactamase superfamily)
MPDIVSAPAAGRRLCMKRIVLTLMALGMAELLFAASPTEIVKSIGWYGGNSLRIQLAGLIVWIDPVSVSVNEKADIILITHTHGDHYSRGEATRLSGPKTTVLAAFDAVGYTRVRPGDARAFGSLKVEAVPAYNIIKATNHPKSSEFCGFIISGDGVRIYDSGDTERIPEMKGITCDIVLLPLGQTYTMSSVEDAVQSVLDVKAKIAIPVHYGMYEGTEKDADAFVAALKEKGVDAFRLKKQ